MIYDHIQKTATGEGDDYTIGRLLGYPYFKEQYKMIAINLSINKFNIKLDIDPKAIQQLILQEI